MALNRMNCFSNLKNLEKPRKMPKGAKSPKSHDRLFGLLFGGGRGIRTPVGLLPNGFQDRLVMTASICLRMYENCRSAEIISWNIQFSILQFPLELPLEPPVLPSCGMPGKSRTERVSGLLPSVVSAKFQVLYLIYKIGR